MSYPPPLSDFWTEEAKLRARAKRDAEFWDVWGNIWQGKEEEGMAEHKAKESAGLGWVPIRAEGATLRESNPTATEAQLAGHGVGMGLREGQPEEDTGTIRTFASGATRDTATNKPDYEGFLSPRVVEAFGAYMLAHQKQSDGSLRASDNWQKGIPREAYVKSTFRHFVDLWFIHRGLKPPSASTSAAPDLLVEACCALLFNVGGYLHEYLKAKEEIESAE